MKTFNFENGKYNVTEENGKCVAIRYGEPWRDLTGDKLIGCMLDEIERLKVNAQRYEMLRQMHWSEGRIAVVLSPKQNVRLGSRCPSHEALDYTLDEMIKAKEKKNAEG